MRDILVATMILTTFMNGQASSAQHTPPQHSVTSLADMIDRVRGCVVRVLVSSGGRPISSGTGFLVNGDGIVITAAHVVHPLNAPPPLTITVQMRVPTIHGKIKLLTSWSGSDANVVAENTAHDVVALRPLMNVFTKPFYSSAGCSPASPASASPTGTQCALHSSCWSTDFHRTANCVLTVCLTPGGRPNRCVVGGQLFS
jgi:hypothetical protein